MRVEAVVAAGGSGERLGLGCAKPLVMVGGRPLIVHAIQAVSGSQRVDRIIVVVRPEDRETIQDWVRDYGFHKVTDIVDGGATRRESVARGLSEVDHAASYVVVHDAARPLVAVADIDAVISAAETADGAVLAVPVISTIKEADPATLAVVATLERSRLWEIQTPQVFRRDVLIRAHREVPASTPVTDDASMVEYLGGEVRVVRGSYHNIKITTPEDLVYAEALLRRGERG